MIIFEGGDLAGKTTAAEYIARRTKSEFVHLGRPEAGKRHWDDVVQSFRSKPNNVVYDRCCIGSYVYGQIMHDEFNQNSVTFDEMLRWAQVVAVNEGLVVWARADQKVICERYKTRGDDYVSLEKILLAHELYENAFRRLVKEVPSNFRLRIYNSGTSDAEMFWFAHKALIADALEPRKNIRSWKGLL